jgi:hypothetical protein
MWNEEAAATLSGPMKRLYDHLSTLLKVNNEAGKQVLVNLQDDDGTRHVLRAVEISRFEDAGVVIRYGTAKAVKPRFELGFFREDAGSFKYQKNGFTGMDADGEWVKIVGNS